MHKKQLNCIDLFCGCGGFSAGFTSLGINVLGAVDNNRIFALTHQQNHPDCQTIHADLTQYPPEAFAEKTKILPEDIDIVIGSPPCQTFSTIGVPKIKSLRTEIKEDPRNYLFENYFQYIEYFKPKLFIMENVPTLETRYKGHLFGKIKEKILNLGYNFDSSTLNSAEYGVPQIRRRLFIIGYKKDKFVWPSPTHASEHKNTGMLPFNTVYDAISDLPIIHDGCRFNELPYSKKTNLSGLQQTLRNSTGVVGNNVCRVSNERAKKVFMHMKQGDKYMDLPKEVRAILPFREDIFHDRLKRLVEKEPSWTMLAHIGMDGYMYIHPTENRTLSVREAARIQSFPDHFCFLGNMREQYIQVGNAVPFLLGQAMAHAAIRYFQNEIC